jgi:hypothetical protein
MTYLIKDRLREEDARKLASALESKGFGVAAEVQPRDGSFAVVINGETNFTHATAMQIWADGYIQALEEAR